MIEAVIIIYFIGAILASVLTSAIAEIQLMQEKPEVYNFN